MVSCGSLSELRSVHSGNQTSFFFKESFILYTVEYINFLELLAIKYVIALFQNLIKGYHIPILMDNTSAVSNINLQSSMVSRKLCILALDLWELFLSLKIHLSATHLPGGQNNQADFLSSFVYFFHQYS